FLDNRKEEGELMRKLIGSGPLVRKKVQDPTDTSKEIDEPIADLSPEDREMYYADIKVMNFIFQGIPNDIYNSIDACQDAQAMWTRVKRLMQGTYLSEQERHSRLMNEFDKFSFEVGKSLRLFMRETDYDKLFDYLSQNEPNANASQDERAARYHNPLALVANSYASPSYSQPLEPYYVTHPQSMHAYDVDYQGEVQGHYAKECPKPKVRDSKYFREQMLLSIKDEAGVHLDAEENDFMLMSAYGDDHLEELNVSVIMTAHIQPAVNESDAEPTYDAEFVSEVNASHINLTNGLLSKIDLEQRTQEKLETIKHTSVYDQIDSDIIFDDLYMEVNSGKVKHDQDAHDQKFGDFESLIKNV
ncbi:hypothetical protein Tco_1353517, partial [Tanacetum coccineum]